MVREPAWVCSSCGAEKFVRDGAAAPRRRIGRPKMIAASVGAGRTGDARELRRTLEEIRAGARRDAAGATCKRMEGLFSELARSRFVSVIAADERARLVEANDAACALTGVTHAELLKLRASDLFSEWPERFDRSWRRFVDTGAFAGACRLRQATGRLITVECVAQANVMPGVHVATLASRRMLQSLA
jgi:PAS domain S-box-containing protein